MVSHSAVQAFVMPDFYVIVSGSSFSRMRQAIATIAPCNGKALLDMPLFAAMTDAYFPVGFTPSLTCLTAE